MNFRKIEAVLILYRHNFQLLHWLVKDEQFEAFHSLTNIYYEKMSEFLDSITEIGLTYDNRPIDLQEAYELLKEDDGDFKSLLADTDYSREDIIENIDIMFNDLMSLFKELINDLEENPGAKSTIENMYSYLDIECNYKNKRRK